jgi:hypothetical protein
MPLRIARTTTNGIDPPIVNKSAKNIPRFLTTGVASAKVILRAGKASARDESMPITAHIDGYANKEATAIPRFGRIIAIYYNQ